MPKHKFFFETVEEANMRLTETIIMYDGHPYFCLCVAEDGFNGNMFAYLDSLTRPKHREFSIPYTWLDDGEMSRYNAMESFLADYPNSLKVVRMDDPLLNGFKPFDLGMMNSSADVMYTMRNPIRSVCQGLASKAIIRKPVSFYQGSEELHSTHLFSIFQQEFTDTILGKYPSYEVCYEMMKDPEIVNKGVAFHREFALMRGPLNTLYLAHQEDYIGILPSGKDTVVLGRDYTHLYETVEECGVFNSIQLEEV